MPSFLIFLVAFAGIGGKDATKVEKQINGLFDGEAEVERVKLTKKQRHALVVRSEDAGEIVRGLDAEGVIAGEIERKKRGATLTVVVYDGEGSLIDLVEISIGKKKARKLGRDDLESLAMTLVPDVERLNAPPPPPEPEPVAVSEADAAGPDDASLAATAVAKVGPKRKREALIRVAAGIGMHRRQFDPGPMEVRGYRSSYVPGAQIAVEVRPIRYVAIGGELERTLVMQSQIDDEAVPTSISGWRATVAARLPLGPIELAALGGVGARSFVIDSATPAPTPNGDYLYAVIGGRITARIGSRIELRAYGAVEPVVGGEEAMPGAARRGLEVGGAVEVGATDHVFVVGEGGYQRFTTTWDEGSSTDDYPSATLSVGARY